MRSARGSTRHATTAAPPSALRPPPTNLLRSAPGPRAVRRRPQPRPPTSPAAGGRPGSQPSSAPRSVAAELEPQEPFPGPPARDHRRHVLQNERGGAEAEHGQRRLAQRFDPGVGRLEECAGGRVRPRARGRPRERPRENRVTPRSRSKAKIWPLNAGGWLPSGLCGRARPLPPWRATGSITRGGGRMRPLPNIDFLNAHIENIN